MFEHKEPFILALPGIVIIQCHTFIDIFEPCTFIIFLSDIHSLSENRWSAERVYSVFIALQVNPSLQKLEWVQSFLFLFTCGHFSIEFHILPYTCIHRFVDPWFRISVLIRWLRAFLTHYHYFNKSSPFGTNNGMCISNMMCFITRDHRLVLIFHCIL